MSNEFDDEKAFERNIKALKTRLGPDFMGIFNDPRTIEIMLNPDGKLWVERLGEPMEIFGELAPYKALSAMRTIATCLGAELTRDKPLLEGEFPIDGSRFAGQIPPVVEAPTFTIRKPASQVFTLEQYVEHGIMTESQFGVICDMILRRKNILICGGTGSGKTTLTNGVIAKICELSPEDRLIVMEDTGEIQCKAVNKVCFHTTSNVTLTHLLKTSLRMRPDRLIVGEVRDHVALDMLDSWNTGHEGGVATIHANDAKQALTRLEGLINRNENPPKDAPKIISEAVHCVIFITKTPEHGRVVQQIMRLKGFADGEYIAVFK